MKKSDTRLINILKAINANSSSLKAENHEPWANLLAQLEEALRAVPATLPALQQLLKNIQAALQDIVPGNQGPDANQAGLIRQALEMAERSLGIDDADIRQKLLESVLADITPLRQAKPASPASPELSNSEIAQIPSLDDAAMLLIQLEPTDRPGLQQLKQIFVQINASPETSAAAKEMTAEAIAKLDQVLAKKKTGAAAALLEIGMMMEVLSESADQSTPQTAHRIAATPAAPPAAAPSPVSKSEAPGNPLAGEKPAGDSTPDVESLQADTDATLLGDFITESRDMIQGAESALLTLETNPDDMESVNTVFRAFHTIKGTSAFLGLQWITQLAHHAESLLSRVRDREIRCTGGYADLALRSSDMLKDLIQIAQNALGGTPMQKPAQYGQLVELLMAPEAHGITGEVEETPFPPRIGDILIAEGLVDQKQIDAVLADNKNPQPLGVKLVQSKAVSVTDVAKALRTQKRMETSTATALTDNSMRVRTDRLDKLIDMVGELVIAQSMLSQDETVVRGGHIELVKKVTHSNKLVRELQDLSMSMRMVPLRATFQKMNRLVRDLAHKSGKQVNFMTEGDDTEIDRNMVDVLNDPLVHIIRNSVDHGIEPPDVRGSSGKERAGTVRLAAFHAGGNVVVGLHDDGKGLDRQKILQKAINKGLVEPDRILTESEITNLIFMPGFSTADKVTDVSGRGVGMDVVKRSIEKLHGKIEITSELGRGTSLIMRLPLTLAITDGMLVKVGRERYLLPTANIYISFRPEGNMLSTIAGRGEMVMLRGELLPVFRLHRLFNVQGAVEDPQEGLLVVIGDGADRCALLVDELLGQHQVVAKSLGSGIGKILGVAGGAILGNGRVGLILDPVEISSLARQTE